MNTLLALDRGNSGLKAALFRGEEIKDRLRLAGEGSIELAEKLIREFSPEGIAFCSVVPSWSREFREKVEEMGCKNILDVNSAVRLPFSLLVKSPEKLGADRICAAAGARADGSSEAVIVDMGTAVTVDLLTSSGFRGGSIIPGPRAMLDSLNRSAEALEDIALPPENTESMRIPGRSTQAAIKAGIHWGLAGAVEKLVRLTAQAAGSRPDIYLTGGEAGSLRADLEFPFIHDQDLVFRGLFLIYRNL